MWRASVIGRISMDLITVDVSAVPEEACGVGMSACLVGAERDADALAHDAGTLGYEILTSLGSRVARVYARM